MNEEYLKQMAIAYKFQSQAEVAEAAAHHAAGDEQRRKFYLDLAERSTKLAESYSRMAEMGD